MLVLLATTSLTAAAPWTAEVPRSGLLPGARHEVASLDARWTPAGEVWRSEILAFEDGGSRVAVLLSAPPGASPLLEARAVDEAGVAGPWLPLDEVWRGGDAQRVLRVDLSAWSPAAQLRVIGLDQLGQSDVISWELLSPVHEPSGAEAAPPPPAPAVSAALEAIGVVPREDWGASATSCTTTEDDWYRFAIHHTAGSQTSGGTVQGAVQALQAYAMGSGGYCDIPYQFVVGYDGSLWEGRNLAYYSGATGSGNNDGNIAISFLGCYDSSGCGSIEVDETLIMLAGARLLAQTLAAQEATETSASLLKGHRDHDGASTACPGDKVHARLDEIRSETAHYEGELADTAWGGGVVEVELGETVAGWVQFENTGIFGWDSDTKLAPLPRDTDSPLAAEAWLAGHRISVPELDTAPGEIATFPLEVYGHELGTHSLSLALVQEGVTWFPDAPLGGGPAEGGLVLTVEVVEPGSGSGGGEGGGGEGGGSGGGGSGGGGTGGDEAGSTGSGDQELGSRSGPREPEVKRCGCAAGPGSGGGGLLLALAALAGLRRRRRD